MPENSSATGSTSEETADSAAARVRLTDTQRQILAALCRAQADGSRYATPATNQEIAGEVYLSVDAVKAHLRALYRKFGVEPLPHNQKRARLVELVIEGGYLSGEVGDRAAAAPPPAPPGVVAEPSPAPAGAPAAAGGRAPARTRSTGGRGRLIIGSVAALAILAGAVALAGVFAGGSAGDAPDNTLSETAYRAAVNDDCKLAMSVRGRSNPATRAARAGSYLGVFATMSDRLRSLGPPQRENAALDRFRTGLSGAANHTYDVTKVRSRPGQHANAKTVAGLTLAAGQVQAGAIGYGLGPACSAIGDLVEASARNAAGPP